MSIAVAMEVCPMCATCPRLAGRWRLQVRCSCGACGPKMKTENEAIGRWNCVVRCVRELSRAGMTAAQRHHPRRVRRFVGRLTAQLGLSTEVGF